MQISKHASIRGKQRCISIVAVQLILRKADVVLSRHGGARKVLISRRRLRVLRNEGISHSLLEKAADIAIVVASNGELITAMHVRPSRHRRPTI